MKQLNFFTLLIFILTIFGCKSYTVPVDSFQEQMIKGNNANLKKVEINNPLIGFNDNIKYYSNSLSGINVFDKKGNMLYLENSPSIEMRVTLKNEKKRIFYFDTVYIENDSLKGSQSRFIPKIREIAIKDIVKIELQDGGKKFSYQ